MVVPPTEPVPSRRTPSESGREFGRELPPFQPASREETRSLEFLRDLISGGEQRLDLVLAAIADAAWGLTGASGSALAMWKDGVMLCRARSGGAAPPLGMQLNAHTGISGECLRTGMAQHVPDTENDPLVDVEVCRTLGWRSIAVLPIRGWRGINGILEVFSSVPYAFTEHQIVLLGELAALAERARSMQPQGASQVYINDWGKVQASDRASTPGTRDERAKASGILPASDRVGDVALAVVGGRSRRFVLGAIGMAAIALVALAIWLGWRGPEDKDNRAQRPAQSAVEAMAPARAAETHLPDSDPVWKPNPGGERLFPSSGNQTGAPVQLASKTIVIEPIEREAPPTQSALSKGSAAAGLVKGAVGSGTGMSLPVRAKPGEVNSTLEPPPLPTEAAGSTGSNGSGTINGVLIAKAALPSLAAPLSQGVTGGKLLHSVAPAYPARAKAMRVEGRVVLTAMVKEDGTVSELKVVEGHPMLAESAVDAVKQWRYQPFRLDGKPIARETTITFEFKY